MFLFNSWMLSNAYYNLFANFFVGVLYITAHCLRVDKLAMDFAESRHERHQKSLVRNEALPQKDSQTTEH